MNSITQGTILLIKSAVTGESCQLPDGLDLEQVYSAMARHGILPMGYLGARNCGVDKHNPVMRKFFLGYGKSLQISEGQMAGVARICDALDAAKIDYMPLKGCNMKPRYPFPELRMMGDADILIRMEQYDRIREIMLGLGFTEGPETDHELVWESPTLYVEFHKRLIPTYTKDYSRYYGDGWKLATRQEGTRFSMKPEDEFIYIFTHMAKHYRYGGIGFRQVTDLWVFLRAFPQMDEAYMEGELKKLRLLEFYRNIRRTLGAWFEDQEADPVTVLITDYIFNSGCWGTSLNHSLSAAVESMDAGDSVGVGRLLWGLQTAFPSAASLSGRYPVLRKYPVLLPVMWIWRWMDAIMTRPEHIRTKYQSAREMTDKNLADFQKSLHAVGLDFCFDEEK